MFDAKSIDEALSLLAGKMAAEGICGEMLLAGGAVMSLVLGERGLTRDVDAVFSPRDDIKRLSAAVAAELGLPKDWLSDSVSQFAGEDAVRVPYKTYGAGALIVSSVSEEYLLAMKMMAIRYGTEDIGDIGILVSRLGISDADEALEILYSYFPMRSAPMGVRDAVVDAMSGR